MDKIAKPLAVFALLLTIGPPTWRLVTGVSNGPAPVAATDAAVAAPTANADAGLMTESRMKTLMAVGAVLWFATAPFWLKEDKPAEDIIEKPGLQAVP